MTQTRHKVCAPPAKVGSVCTNAASRQVLSSLSTLQPLSSASELWSHQAADDRLPNRPRWLWPMNTQLHCSVSLPAHSWPVWQIPPSPISEKFSLFLEAFPGFLRKVSVLLYVIPLYFMYGNKKYNPGRWLLEALGTKVLGVRGIYAGCIL